MGELQYRILDDSLRHASFASVKSSLSDRYRARKKEQAEQRERNGSPTSPIVGRTHLTRNPYGNYKSVYYDPVARHERYLREKDHTTRPYGTGKSEGSGKRGRGGGKSGSGGKGSKGRSGGSRGSVGDAIAKLREESSLDSEAHREAARRKIEELREQLKQQLDALQKAQEDENSTSNTAEIRGKIQRIREQIEAEGGDLQEWLANEKEALQKRIARLTGSDYDKTKVEQQKAAKNKETQVSSRADAIYKRKSKN